MTTIELQDLVSKVKKDYLDFEHPYSNNNLKEVVSCIDLTTLSSTDSPKSVSNFVQKGLSTIQNNHIPNVAAFCVFANFTQQTAKQLQHTGINTACVAAAFPHGQSPLSVRVKEVSLAANNGADEIDVVINRGLVRDGKMEELEEEIKAFKVAANQSHLKTILEVCDLDLSQIYQATKYAIRAGSDFIKTSTGKGSGGASIESAIVICTAIKEHYQATGRRIGFKAAGGISTSNEAMKYLRMVKMLLGNEWATPEYFRIGASSLLNNIINDIV